MKIAWIGAGIMGKAMLTHLLDANHQVSIYTRTMSKVSDLSHRATLANSIQEAIKDVDVLFTMVSLPLDVEAVYLGEDGILAHASSNTICVDMTTSSPTLASKIAQIAKTKNIQVLDAPVSGGDIGAKNATLTIMVGGDQQAAKQVWPLFQLLGKTITHVGPAGAGQHTKMANQIAVASNVAGVAESISYASKVGLDPKLVLAVISGGAAASWQLSNNGSKMIDQDFNPGFMIVHFIKDLKLVLAEAKKVGLELPVVEKVLDLYQQNDDPLWQVLGTQALIKQYQLLP